MVAQEDRLSLHTMPSFKSLPASQERPQGQAKPSGLSAIHTASRLRMRRVGDKPLDLNGVNPFTMRFFDPETKQRIIAMSIVKRFVYKFRVTKLNKPSHWSALRQLHQSNVQLQTMRYKAKAHALSRQEFVALGKGAAFWEQGDHSLHSADMYQKRMALRKHPLVARQLFKWCEIVDDPVPYKQYKELMLAIYKALIEPPFDIDDAIECANEDWAEDSGSLIGYGSLSRRKYMDAIFQLADHWTMGVTGEEYAKFLRITLGLISEDGQLKSLNNIGHGDINALMLIKSEEELRAEEERRRLAAERAYRNMLYKPPKIPVHPRSKPLLVSRRHFVSPLIDVERPVSSARVAPLPWMTLAKVGGPSPLPQAVTATGVSPGRWKGPVVVAADPNSTNPWTSSPRPRPRTVYTGAFSTDPARRGTAHAPLMGWYSPRGVV